MCREIPTREVGGLISLLGEKTLSCVNALTLDVRKPYLGSSAHRKSQPPAGKRSSQTIGNQGLTQHGGRVSVALPLSRKLEIFS
jgi:hypothetical protein